MKFSYFYAVLLVAELVAVTQHLRTVEFVTKPLLAVSLMIYFLVKIKNDFRDTQNRWMFASLVFCLCGDIILLFDNAFIFGLISFLIGHLCFIFTFLKDNAGFAWQKNRLIWFVVGTILSGFLFLSIVLPSVNAGLQLPILVYATTILTMLVVAYNRRRDTVSRTSHTDVLVGALLFILSDGLLAVNQFVQPFSLGRLIMLTYGAALYFLVTGFLQKKNLVGTQN